MSSNNKIYLDNRRKYARPEAIMFADMPPTTTVVGGKTFYIPQGYEVGESAAGEDFLILSDHNRKTLEFSNLRIENRQRTINGRMRSYFVADKKSLSVSWDMLPSRAFNQDPNFGDTGTAVGGNSVVGSLAQYTIDGGAGGNELLDWYENHTGSFWVFLSYDKPSNFVADDNQYSHLAQYSEVMEMFVSDFSYGVQKRGERNFDLWNVSIKLEEV
jgi:hypothetical protein